MKRYLTICGIFFILFLVYPGNARSQYLKRSLNESAEVKTGISSLTSHYRPLFGEGDNNSGIIRGLSRYGFLEIEAGGRGNEINPSDEELLLFICGGTGILKYEKEQIPVAKNDFLYIPDGMEYSILNPREQPLTLIMMGFKLPPGASDMIRKLMIANTDEVKLQTLPSHGPTTQFQLLLGTTESTRDRLAASCQVTSLFIMDFASGGTNNPHSHANEEEIYLILRGKGDIVAGKTDAGGEFRHPSKEGDVFYFSPGTLIGFYSGNTQEEEHAQILAVRFRYPGAENKTP